MSVETLRFQQPTLADTSDRPSESIWADCPWNALKAGDIAGTWMEDDFKSFNKTPATTEGNWSAGMGYAQFSSTGGFITAGTGQGGEIVIGSDDDNEGVGIRTLATPFLIARTAKSFWFECRVKLSTIANTTFEEFIGLIEDVALTAVVPITTTAATLSDNNMVGFYRTESVGSSFLTTYKANGVTAVTVQAAAVTLVANAYVKIGMKFNSGIDVFNSGVGDGYGKYLFSFFGDGQLLSTQKQIPSAAGTDFPNDVGLGLVLATRNAAGSSPGNSTIDWWRAAQLF